MGNSAKTRELHIPNFVVYTLTLLGIIDKSISSLFSIILALFHSIEFESSLQNQENQSIPAPFEAPLSAILLRELLPVAKFSDVVYIKCGGGDEQLPQECAVCLNEFEGDEEIRCLKNCQHFFHRGCIDRWMDQERQTCPLCRSFLVPVDSRKEFDNRLLLADFCADYCLFDED